VSVRVSPADRIRGEIDALFAADRDLVEVLEDVARLGARLIIQTAVEAEVTEFLGRARYQRTAHTEDARPGARNGYCPTTIKTTAGPVTIDRPKLRGTTERFASRLFGAGVTKTNALESLVIAGFVRGLSVRDVEATLADALGAEAALSKSTVSRVGEAIKDEFDRWSARRLDEVELDYLFLDGSCFKLHPAPGRSRCWLRGHHHRGQAGVPRARPGRQRVHRRLERLPRGTQGSRAALAAADHLRWCRRPDQRRRDQLRPLAAPAVSDPPKP
jgi:hypothetical protein